MNNKGWIGVDLDGTLAEYHGWQGPEHIGAPVASMVAMVKHALAAGHEVRIFTARITPFNQCIRSAHDLDRIRSAVPLEKRTPRLLEAHKAGKAIFKWCVQHIGTPLTITNVKDYDLFELWDDRAISVEKNTGKLAYFDQRVRERIESTPTTP